MNVEIVRDGAIPVPDFDHTAHANKAYQEIAAQLQLKPREWTLRLFFIQGHGWSDSAGIHLPGEWPKPSPPSPSLTPDLHYFLYLKHEMVHYVTQVLESINPTPTCFINEGLAQSQAEGPALIGIRGFGYHDLVAAALRQGKYVPLSELLDNTIFLRRRREPGPVMAENASFHQWIGEKFGMATLLKTFKIANGKLDDSAAATRQAFEQTTSWSFSALEDEWKSTVAPQHCLAAEHWGKERWLS